MEQAPNRNGTKTEHWRRGVSVPDNPHVIARNEGISMLYRETYLVDLLK